jgi:alpha-methylacyl-CoA racemase
MAGPLAGYRTIEVAGIGPGPYAAMLLSDMGADVIRVDRAPNVREDAAGSSAPSWDVLNRGRRSIGIDLKLPDGVETLLKLAERADALIEGFRPGVMERLGVGPDECLARNPRLVFGRVTGWGQEGPYSHAAGHDINYVALAGALAHIGRAGQAPVPPLNLVGDFGGGTLLAFGVLCALLERQRSGRGQVVDAAMVDATALSMTMFHGLRAAGIFDETRRGTNLLDTGAHFYDVYACADGEYVSVGSIEPQFYAELMRLTGLEGDPDFAKQMDRTAWPALKARMAQVFKTKTRAEWCSIMERTEVCFAPVLTMGEAHAHPHNVHRRTFMKVAGVTQPAPAPRFSRTSPEVARPPAVPGQHSADVLLSWGFTAAEIERLFDVGAVR